jgi:hypothetical protein
MGRTPGRVKDRPFQMRVTEAFLKAVDKWRLKQEDAPSRAEAIRRLVELGLQDPAHGQLLQAKGRPKSDDRKSRQGTKPRRETKQRARELAGSAIDRMSDATASADDQVSRKRGLIGGPEEFRNVRRDRSKPK